MHDLLFWLKANYIEVIGTLSGIAGVWLTTRQIIWCWPVSLVNVLCYVYVFFMTKLYADFGLQFFYLALIFYGWYHWIYGGKDRHELQVNRLSLKGFAIYFFTGSILTILTGILLARFTNASLPFLDSFLGVWSIICTLLMAKKIVENWLIWVVVDGIYIGMYIYKGLYPTSILYLLYALIALYGYFEWKKEYNKLNQAKFSA